MTRLAHPIDRLLAERRSLDGGVSVWAVAPGPAGLVTARLAGGRLELEVDRADPDLLVALHLDGDDGPATRRALEAIVGPVAADRLRAAGPTAEPIWERARDEPDDAWRHPARRGTAPVGLGEIGRLGLLAAEVLADDLPSHALGVGLVELAVASLGLRDELAPHPDGVALLAAGLRAWEDHPPDPDELGTSEAQLLAALATSWVPRARGRAPDVLERRLVRMAASLEGQVAGRGGVVLAAQAMPLVGAAASAPPAAARRSMARRAEPAVPFEVLLDPPLEGAGARLVGAEVRDGHLWAHLSAIPPTVRDVAEGRHAGGAWLRVFRAGERPVLVSMAALAPGSGPWWSARAVLPGDGPLEGLLADVTCEPGRAWAHPPTRRTELAVRLGEQAARAGRLGAHDADDRWLDARAAWARAGDPGRAAAALGYAKRGPSTPATATDLVRGT